MGENDVIIELTGEEFALKPSLKACTTLARRDGGITSLVQKCNCFEFDAIHSVIIAGIGQNSKDLPERIYQTGLIQLAPKCIEYLHIVANGGRRPGSDDEKGVESDPK